MLEVFAENGVIWAHARVTPDFEALCNDVSTKHGVEVRPWC